MDPSQNFYQIGIKAGSTETILIHSKDQETFLSSKKESTAAIKVKVFKGTFFSFADFK